MKRILIILIIMLGVCGGIASAQCCHEGRRQHRDDCREYECRHDRSLYRVVGNTVFFDGREIEGASAMSFVILRDGYARDSWNVYYCGSKIKGASSNSFNVLGRGYAKDTWNVYYNGRKIDGASAGSFEVLSDGYAKDTWNTYYNGRKV